MSQESFSPKPEQTSPAELKLEKVTKELADLDFVLNSLKIERSVQSDASKEEKEAVDAVSAASDVAMENAMTSGSVSEEDTARINDGKTAQADAREWREDVQIYSMDQGGRKGLQSGQQLDPAFVEKLESLGVNLDASWNEVTKVIKDGDGLTNLLYERRTELAQEQRNAQMDVPGEKQKVVLDLIKSLGVNEGDRLNQITRVIDNMRDPMINEGAAAAFDQVSQIAGLTNIASYPDEAVKESLRIMVRQAFASTHQVGGNDLTSDGIAEQFYQRYLDSKKT